MMSTKLLSSKAPLFKSVANEKENKKNQEKDYHTFFDFDDEDMGTFDFEFDSDKLHYSTNSNKRRNRFTTPLQEKKETMEKRLKASNLFEDEESFGASSPSIRVNKTANCNVIVKVAETDKEQKDELASLFSETEKSIVEPEKKIADLFSMLPPPVNAMPSVSLNETLASALITADYTNEGIVSPSRSSSASSSRSQSPEPAAKREALQTGATLSLEQATYDCPDCDEEDLALNELCDHVANMHPKPTENLVCPVCAETYGDAHAARVKDLRVHLETHRTPGLRGSGLFRSPVTELITRGVKPNNPFSRARHTNKNDTADMLWEFVLTLDIEKDDRATNYCSACFEDLKSNDVHAILSCVHTFHADCLQFEHCPLCKKTEKPQKEQKKTKTKKLKMIW